ncbi:MAG: TIGR02147 family protein [Bacteriovoracaceae bacterium]|nr:TIGR02147 family protein [Bacteriovoracaceae bacterium]
MLSIYHYTQPNLFLRAAWEEKKKKNSAFSLRGWARQMGLRSHTPLQLIIKGDRQVPKKYIPFFIQSLNLDASESLYFETLTNYSRSKNDFEKNFYFSRLQKLGAKRPLETIEFQHYEFLRDPLNIAILEMISLPNFQEDPAWIVSQLFFTSNVQDVKNSINRLIELGLMDRNETGKLVRSYQHVSSPHDIRQFAVKEYHKGISELAIKAVYEQDVEEREFNGYAFNIKKADLARAKKMIREFGQSFVREFEVTEDADAVYQFNIQFFNLLKSHRSEQ